MDHAQTLLLPSQLPTGSRYVKTRTKRTTTWVVRKKSNVCGRMKLVTSVVRVWTAEPVCGELLQCNLNWLSCASVGSRTQATSGL